MRRHQASALAPVRVTETKHSDGDRIFGIRLTSTLRLNAHTRTRIDARMRMRRFNVGRVLVLNTPRPARASSGTPPRITSVSFQEK